MTEKTQGLKVLVGEPWPDEIEVSVEEQKAPEKESTSQDSRNLIILGSAIFLWLFLGAFMVYGMMQSEAILTKVFDLVNYGVSVLLGFVFGQFIRGRPP